MYENKINEIIYSNNYVTLFNDWFSLLLYTENASQDEQAGLQNKLDILSEKMKDELKKLNENVKGLA